MAKLNQLLMTTAAFCVVGLYSPSMAAMSVELEEIVVTAQKRVARMQDIPVAISAITAQSIRDAGITRIEDFSNSIPNVYFDKRNLRDSSISIRGIVSETNNPGVDQGVGVYVDGVYIGRPTAINTSLFDLERIEVLRGPQGTLYGKNTIAGAINLISRKPDDEARVEARARYGNYDAMSGYISMSGPLAPGKVYASVAGTIEKRDGYITNTFTGTDLDDADSIAGRATLLFKPQDNLEIVVRADASRDRTNSGASEVLDNGAFTGAPFADADPTDRMIANNLDTIQDRDIFGTSLELNWSFDMGTLTSISAYREFDWYNFADNDFSVLNMLASGITEDQHQYSQEIRFASPSGTRFEYVVGAYYYYQTLDTIASALVGPDLGIYPDDVTADIFADVTTESVAVFGQGTYNINDQFSLTAGLRYTDEQKKLKHSQTGDPFELLQAALGEQNFKRSDSELSPTISVNYKPNDDMLLYASFSRGFKSGGYNAFSITATDSAQYEPEFVSSWEVGFKSDLLDRKLRFNAAAFYLDYKDLQVNQLLLVGGIPQFQTSNAAKAESKGVELELTARPVQGLDLAASYGYLDATFDDYQNATSSGDDFTGNRLVKAPKHNFSVSGQYVTPVTDRINVFARAEVTYRSRVYYSANNILSQGGVALVNGRIGLAESESGWEIYLWGRNLTDRDYVINRLAGVIVPGQTIQSLAAPRTYGVEARVKF